MSQLATAFAMPLEFTHKGKNYVCSLVTQSVKAQFEKKLFGRAKDAAKEMRDCCTRDEYLSYLADLNTRYLRGDYAFESPTGLESCKSITGMKLLVSLLFNITEEEALELATDAKEELTQVVSLSIKMSFPGIDTGEADEKGDEKKSP